MMVGIMQEQVAIAKTCHRQTERPLRLSQRARAWLVEADRPFDV